MVRQALYVIDGIIRDETAFKNLNVNDIENVSFLKDAAATAVFGSKAAADALLWLLQKAGLPESRSLLILTIFAWNTPANFLNSLVLTIRRL